MVLIGPILNWVMRKRIHQMELFIKYPLEVQRESLLSLVEKAKDTEWGRKHRYGKIETIQQFKDQVPVSTYEQFYPWIEKTLKGRQNVLWPSKIKWFAKSSGTTNAASKFIPVTPESLDDCHFKGGKDMLSFYVNNYPNADVFSGKGISIGGSHEANKMNPGTRHGDVSAVLTENLPLWVEFFRLPKKKTALLSDWDEKIERMIEETVDENVVSITGVPTWTAVFLQKAIEHTGKKNAKEIWPNLELFIHGAVAFGPYQDLFDRLIGERINYLEIYNASEGFFGIQDQPDHDDLLLMLDYGMFYEFMPLEELGKAHPVTYQLDEIELGKSYALIISTNGGLWRYLIGDTIKFTSTDPFRIKITGRTKHFLNAYGEEVVVENADAAIAAACAATGATILDYTAAPIYFQEGSDGGHEWVIECQVAPTDPEQFVDVLDQTLRQINSDYDAKRHNDMALRRPTIHFAPEGQFHKWLASKGKLGGQHKVPRLMNDRSVLEEVLALT